MRHEPGGGKWPGGILKLRPFARVTSIAPRGCGEGTRTISNTPLVTGVTRMVPRVSMVMVGTHAESVSTSAMEAIAARMAGRRRCKSDATAAGAREGGGVRCVMQGV